MPPTELLFRTIWDVEQTWMPELRALCNDAEATGKEVVRLASVDDINTLAERTVETKK